MINIPMAKTNLWTDKMTTLREICTILLLASLLILLTEVEADSSVSGSLWKRSYRMHVFATSPSSISLIYPIPARSTLECLRICQLSPVCHKFCFIIPSNSCFADANIMTSSYDSGNPDMPCYFRVGSCSPIRGYSLVNGRCMKVHDTSPAKTDYSVAAATCSGEGGHLFDMLTSHDEVALTQFLEQHEGVLPHFLLLGARLIGGLRSWSDGSLMTGSMPWGNGEPNGGDAEICLAIYVTTRKLLDISCQVSAFVCQIDM